MEYNKNNSGTTYNGFTIITVVRQKPWLGEHGSFIHKLQGALNDMLTNTLYLCYVGLYFEFSFVVGKPNYFLNWTEGTLWR